MDEPPDGLLDAAETLALLEREGIAMEAARVAGVTTLTHAIVGEEIRGSWWGHPDGHHIYNTLNQVRESADVLAFKLVQGKVTYAHRRVWPALVRLAEEIGSERLTAVENVHTEAGHHERIETPYPEWVDDATSAAARELSPDDARTQLPRSLIPR